MLQKENLLMFLAQSSRAIEKLKEEEENKREKRNKKSTYEPGDDGSNGPLLTSLQQGRLYKKEQGESTRPRRNITTFWARNPWHKPLRTDGNTQTAACWLLCRQINHAPNNVSIVITIFLVSHYQLLLLLLPPLPPTLLMLAQTIRIASSRLFHSISMPNKMRR